MEAYAARTSCQPATCLAWDFSTRFLMEGVNKSKTRGTSRRCPPKPEVNSTSPNVDLPHTKNLLHMPSPCNTLAFLTDDCGGKTCSRTVSASLHASFSLSEESGQLEKNISRPAHHRGDLPTPQSDRLPFSSPGNRSPQISFSQKEVTAPPSLDPEGPRTPLNDSPSECVSHSTYMYFDSSSEETLLPTLDEYSSATCMQPANSSSSLSLSSSETPSSISPTSDFSPFSLSFQLSSIKDAVTQCERDTEAALELNGINEPCSVLKTVSLGPLKTETPADPEKSGDCLIKQEASEVKKTEKVEKVDNPGTDLRSGFGRDDKRSIEAQMAGRRELLYLHRLTPQPLPSPLQNDRPQTKGFSAVSKPKMRAQFRQLLLFRSSPSVTRRFIIRDNLCLQLAHDGYCKDRRLFCTLKNYAGARAELVVSKPADSYGRLTYFLYLHARTWDQMRWIVRDIDRYYPQWRLPGQLTQ
ncbi:hypothetical protein AAHC03_04807 [Spirometra sp. Aus1]